MKTPFLETLARVATDNDAPPSDAALDLTRRPPWELTDYDARTHGSATFRAAWSGVAGWLHGTARGNEPAAAVDTPHAWLYARYAGAHQVRDALGAALLKEPWLPIFPLYRLNAVLPGIGPVWTDPASEDEAAADRYIATMIAYGLAPRVPDASDASAAAARILRLAGAMHERQNLNPVDRLAFGDGRALMSAVDALSSGLWRFSRLYIRHADGLEIWVNGSREPWSVIIGAGPVAIPSHGWYAAAAEFLCASTLIGSARVDRVRSPGFAYHDGRGEATFADGLACAAPVAIRDEPHGLNRKMSIEFPRGPARIGIEPPIFPSGARVVHLAASRSDGSAVRPPVVHADGLRLWLAPSPDSRVVDVEWTK